MLDLKQVGERCTDLLRETHGGKEAAEVLQRKGKRKRKNLNWVDLMRKRTFRFVSTTWMELLMLALALNVG